MRSRTARHRTTTTAVAFLAAAGLALLATGCQDDLAEDGGSGKNPSANPSASADKPSDDRSQDPSDDASEDPSDGGSTGPGAERWTATWTRRWRWAPRPRSATSAAPTRRPYWRWQRPA
ncbi:hypothetical protein NKH77_25955 [Streptomyces sp. M19]